MHKVSVIADVQLHSYAAFSTMLPSGRNSRLQHGADALKFAVDAAEGGYLIILGDLFEDRRALTIDVMDAAAECLEYASKALKGTFIVVGNHDQYFRDGSITSLRAFNAMKGVRVVDSFLIERLSGVDYHMAAFHEECLRVKEWIADSKVRYDAPRMLCVHQAVYGAEADGGFLYTSADALVLDDLREELFQHVLVGHFHKPQSLSAKTHYIGSPYQIKMNEEGQEKRIAVITGTELEWVPVPGIPTFRKILAADFELLSAEEIKRHFWEVEGELGYQMPNVRNKPPARAETVYASACSSMATAAPEWLQAHGRPDLVAKALGFLA